MTAAQEPLRFATSVADAVAAVAGEGRVALAGGTWLMRAPIRQEPKARAVVALSRLEALREVSVDADAIRIGAAVTHAGIADALRPHAFCAGLAGAAAHAANPAIRNVATLGGNLCATAFPASDLIPALLALDAEIDVVTVEGERRMPIDAFLAFREATAPPWILLRAVIRCRTRRAAHIRLPLRKAGDYPVAIVSVSAGEGAGGRLVDPRIAVGSVEAVARRWTALEDALADTAVTPDGAAAAAEAESGAFAGRDGVEAPGWYRVKVLPSLVRKAIQALQDR